MSDDQLSYLDPALRSADEQVRYQAVAEAARAEGEHTIQVLEAALSDDSWRVRKAAVAAFVERSGDDTAWRVIMAGLVDEEDAGRRAAVLELMDRLYDRLHPRILELSRHDNVLLRKCAVDVMSTKSDTATIEALLERAADDSPNVRGVAVEALGRIDDPRAVSTLTQVLMSHADRDPLELLAALRGLVDLGAVVEQQTVVPLLEDPLLRAQALRLTARCAGDEVVALLVAAIDKTSLGAARAATRGLYECCSDDAERRVLATTALRQNLERSREGLLAVYRGHAQVSLEAVLGIATWIRDPQLCAQLFMERRGRWIGPGLYAVLAACETEGARAVAAQLGIMEPDDQLASLEALTLLGDVTVAASVAVLLESATGRVAEAAARCLGEVGQGAHAPALARQLSNIEPRVAENAAEALQAMADRAPDAIRDALLAFLADDVATDVRARALRVFAAVAQDADEPALERLRGSDKPQMRADALRGLGRLSISPQRRRALVEAALQDSDSKVRAAAFEPLCNEALPGREELLDSALGDTDAQVRAAALNTAAKLCPEIAVPHLRRTIAGDIEDARAAVGMLQHLKIDARSELLRVAIASEQPRVVAAVAHLLPMLTEAEATALLPDLLVHPGLEVRLTAVGSARVLPRQWPGCRDRIRGLLRTALDSETEAIGHEAIVALISELEAGTA